MKRKQNYWTIKYIAILTLIVAIVAAIFGGASLYYAHQTSEYNNKVLIEKNRAAYARLQKTIFILFGELAQSYLKRTSLPEKRSIAKRITMLLANEMENPILIMGDKKDYNKWDEAWQAANILKANLSNRSANDPDVEEMFREAMERIMKNISYINLKIFDLPLLREQFGGDPSTLLKD